jgi:hypothetical protein
MSVKEGRDVTLWCNATGIPEPNITWFRIYQNHSPARIRKSINVLTRYLLDLILQSYIVYKEFSGTLLKLISVLWIN